MYQVGFPNCCTARVLKGFGDGECVYDSGDYMDHKTRVTRIKRELNMAKADGMGIVTAITSTEQKEGAKALRECGFRSSKWASKDQHPETKIKLWYKVLHD